MKMGVNFTCISPSVRASISGVVASSATSAEPVLDSIKDSVFKVYMAINPLQVMPLRL